MDFEIQSITLSNALNVMENINELSDDEISAIEELRLSVRKEFLERRGDTTFEQETSEVLQYLHGLKKLFITNASKDKDDRISINLDNGLTEQLEILHLKGIDLSEMDLGKFFREHKNLSNVKLANCNISNLRFLDFLPKDLHSISLANNPLPVKYADYILRLRQERFRGLDISGCSEILEEFEKRGYEFSSFLTQDRGKLDGKQFYDAFQKALSSKEFTINDMSQLYQYIDFFSDKRAKEQRTVYIDDIDDLSEEYIENINLFAKGENTTLILTPEKAQMLKGMVSKEINVQLLIKNASELSVEQLDELNEVFSLSSIKVDDPEQSLSKQQTIPYDIDTYRKCRSTIDELLQGIDLNIDAPDRDKKIFGEVIKRLADHMSYDYASLKKEKLEEQQAIEEINKQLDEEGIKGFQKQIAAMTRLNAMRDERDSRTSVVCRNMEGGLINNTCVCAGYAEIVRNVFACCGLDAKYISGPNTRTMESGHAWNQINLDGQWYNLDLTWDRDSIVDGKQTEYTLKSDRDFGHTVYDSSKSIKHKCDFSLEIDEVETYIHGDKHIKKDEDKKTSQLQVLEDTPKIKYYLPGKAKGEIKVADLSDEQLRKGGFLKVLESDLTETDIKKSHALLAKTKAEREQAAISVEMEDTYDNR